MSSTGRTNASSPDWRTSGRFETQKRERLRRDYVAITLAADTILGVSKELKGVWAGETERPATNG
jgi:hypothetical protein